MAYGLYKKGKSFQIKKIKGNPRSKLNKKKMVVWTATKNGVKEWAGRFGTKKQRLAIFRRR